MLYFELIKGEILKTEFECEYNPPGQQANNSCQRTTVVVVQVDVGVYSIVTIIFIYKLTRGCYLQVTIL